MALDHPFARAFADARKRLLRPTLERPLASLAPDIVLRQPHRPAIRGHESARKELAGLLRWLPGTHGENFSGEGSADTVFIEWTLVFPVSRGGLKLGAVDRFQLRGSLGTERIVYFDPVPLYLAVALRPWLWPGFLRYRFG